MPRIRSSGVPTYRQPDFCHSQPSVGYGFMITIWQTATEREGLLRVVSAGHGAPSGMVKSDVNDW